jgi:hypothetical protein
MYPRFYRIIKIARALHLSLFMNSIFSWALSFLVFSLLLASPVTSSFVQASERILLTVGEQKIIKHKAGAAATVTNPKSITIKSTPHDYLLIAKKTGFSELKNKNLDLHIYVLPSLLNELKENLTRILNENQNLKLSVKGNTVFLNGTVSDQTEWLELSNLQIKHKRYLKLNLSGDQKTLEKINLIVKKELNEKSFFNVKSEVRNSNIVIYSAPLKEKDAILIKNIAEK